MLIRALLCALALLTSNLEPRTAVAQTIPEVVIDSAITRDSEIIPTGEANAICISNTPGPTPAITLCSTVDLTGKTVLYEIPTYTVATIPAGNPVVVITDGLSASDCTNGGGSTRVICGHNGSAYVALSAGGVSDPGSNGFVIFAVAPDLFAVSSSKASKAPTRSTTGVSLNWG